MNIPYTPTRMLGWVVLALGLFVLIGVFLSTALWFTNLLVNLALAYNYSPLVILVVILVFAVFSVAGSVRSK